MDNLTQAQIEADNKNLVNSFPCIECGEVYTEESGASKGFICEDCLKPKTFICTRYYAIEASTEEEAKEIMRDTENDLDFLKEEEWEVAPEIK